ncbi:MAG: hypothetical protein HC888_01120 [Candidatus Competibacteraceae bacterium]|nr:hypothetical protein [Candidatus Competibacteraceae bacterium]
MLKLCHNYAQNALSQMTLPSGKKLEAVVTEAFGPCNHPDHPEVDWSWYRRYNGDAARIFSQYDFAGMTISNHAEPIFSAWQDVAWQRTTNQFILNNHG